MKKNLKITLGITLLISLLITRTYLYALASNMPEVNMKPFFEVTNTEVAKNEKVEMVINLESIKYDEFTFKLESDEIMDSVELPQTEEINTEKNSNEIVMEVSKEKTNVQSINLYYSIPETKQVGDTIKFVVTITSSMNNEMVGANNEENKNVQDSIYSELPKEYEESIEVEIKIVEGKNENINGSGSSGNQFPNQNGQSSVTQPNISNNNMSMPSGTISYTSAPKVTYNGSDNNYLKKLAVDGYELNREFSKENTTYFVTVNSDVEKLSITAKSDDSDATVCVYGNSGLKEGTNKVLITVTAENGNVRTYRVYVTKNS